MTSKNKRWKVPTPIKVAIGMTGGIFMIIALIGMATQGHAQLQAFTCVGQDNDGKTYVYLSCLKDKQSKDWLIVIGKPEFYFI
jgi:hypothetical protein